jgi:hypothetical protein
VANLPTVSSPLPRDLQQFIQRVREALDGGGLDGAVTARQLVAAGIAGFGTGGVTTTSGNIVETPRPPTGLTASGALANIIATWDAPTYSGHAYTEIWAASQTNAQVAASESPILGQAELVGMTAGNNFAHQIGASATRWYWVRNINTNGLASAYNATNGLEASTGDDPVYLMEVLSEAFGGTSQAPFFQIDTATTINGVSIPAGTYMKAAFIADATITTAKIANAAIDSAKIVDASIVNGDIANATIQGAKIANATITNAQIANATIGSAQITNGSIVNADIANAAITNAKISGAIQSSAYSSGSAGWKIDKNGSAELNNATFRGTIDVASSSSSSTSRLEITNSTIKVFEGSTLRVKLGNLA